MIGRIKSTAWRRVALLVVLPLILVLYLVFNSIIAIGSAIWMTIQDFCEAW
jgi:hypothetical protein